MADNLDTNRALWELAVDTACRQSYYHWDSLSDGQQAVYRASMEQSIELGDSRRALFSAAFAAIIRSYQMGAESAGASVNTEAVEVSIKVPGEYNLDFVLPCPFCNEYTCSLVGPLVFTKEESDQSWSVICPNCNATGPQANTSSEACKIWNQRWTDL